VEEPYDRVRTALRARALTIFQQATRSAEARSEQIVATLDLPPEELQQPTEIVLTVRGVVEEVVCADPLCRNTCFELEWRATGTTVYFPAMEAEVRLHPLGPRETQIEIRGEYHPARGVLAPTLDRTMGHLIAEASVHRFLRSVADRVRQAIAAAP